MEADLILGPIIGGLSHSRVNLWGRAGPGAGSARRLHAWLGSQPDLSDAWVGGQSLPLSPQHGFTGVAPASDLTPDRRYHYWLTLTPEKPPPGEGPLSNGQYPSFRTFPLPGSEMNLKFAFGSCFRPAGDDSGMSLRALAVHHQAHDLRFLLLLGDQIYADSFKTNSLGKVAESLDEYRAVYSHTWSHPSFRQLLWDLPVFMTLDDHEVDDDWRWVDSARSRAYIPWWDSVSRFLQGRPWSETRISRQRVRDALQAYWEHQGMHAPSHLQPFELTLAGQYDLAPDDAGSLAYTFEVGPAAFFVLDTRTMRVRGSGVKTMLGEGQWGALQRWLLQVKAHPVKFLVSSCSLLHRSWIDIPQDRWSGFKKERDRLLHFLAANGIEGLYILSGDLHMGHAAAADLYGPGGRSIPLWEFCSSPLEQQSSDLLRMTSEVVRSAAIKNHRYAFLHTCNNFGVVDVRFPMPGGKPAVGFELYGQDGLLLDSVTT